MGNHQNQLWTFLKPFFMGPITRDLNTGGVRTSYMLKTKTEQRTDNQSHFPMENSSDGTPVK